MSDMHLTEKYRPKTLDDILGQDKIVSIIKKMINTNHIMSFLMFGSPATGKTSIGGAIANDAGIPICFLNAVNLTKKDLENASKDSTKDSPVIIYVDEIHRLTTPNQEFFLPLIEEGSVILIGATTESVYHKITKALRSRMAIFELNDTTREVKEQVLDKIINSENIKITNEAKNYLTSLEDIRVMINSLEFALSVAGEKEIEEDDVKLLGRNHIEGDNQGNYHYSMKAAYQKSVRGSNLDAALYYLSRMLKSGDLESAIRRLRIIAFEDIGLGDVEAVTFAEHAINVAENVVLIDYLPISQLIQTRQPYVSKGQISHAGITGRWDIGDMAVNETQYMEVYTKVIVTGATIINTVTVNSTTQDPKLYNNKAENGTAVPPEADVAVVKKVNNFTPNKYDNVVWTITVVNNGPNVAGNVVVKDILPSGLKYVSNTAPNIGTYSHSNNAWTIGTLNVGVRYSLNITTH